MGAKWAGAKIITIRDTFYVLYKLVDTGTKRNAYSALISQAEKVVHVQVNIHTCCAWLHV